MNISNNNDMPVKIEGSTKKLFQTLMNSRQFQQFTDKFIREPLQTIGDKDKTNNDNLD